MPLIPRNVPRSWVASFAQLRRDVSMVTRGLKGEMPSPLIARKPGIYRDISYRDIETSSGATLLAPRTLRIARIVRETADAVSLVLEDPVGGEISFRPGQFLTLLLTIDGEPFRRAYSIASDCRDRSKVTIAVKRVADGRVSNYVNDALAEGESIQVLGPSGTFGIEPSPEASRHAVLLAGGSGITPMMAIARAVLAIEPKSRATLVYGNRAIGDVVFKDALSDLASAHSDRFTLRHVLQNAHEGWTGGCGILERSVVSAELDALAIEPSAEFFLCGPEPMMAAARDALVLRGVDPSQIMEERFATPHLRAPRKDEEAAGPQILTVKQGGSSHDIAVAPSQTVLEAGLAAGIAMPYSCAMGGCAKCKVRLRDGDVEMEEPNCLTADERAGGYVLACISRLKKASVVELEVA